MDKLPSLYHLSNDVALALEDDSEDSFARLDELLPSLKTKAANVARWIEFQEDLAAAVKERRKLVDAHIRELEAKAARARGYLLSCLERAEASAITDESTGTTIKVVMNPPSVVVDDAEAVPVEFMRQAPPPPPAIDKKALAAAFKDGFEVPGAHVERTRRLEIK